MIDRQDDFCANITPEYPVIVGRLVQITVDGNAPDFKTAQQLATAAAENISSDAMLISWYDRDAGKAAPTAPECSHQPSWLAYAEGHGGDTTVDINYGEFLFIFNSGTAS